MPRLGYKKSRTGCLRCRQRRVKCDEKRPCSACVRHGVECSLLSAPEACRNGESSSERNNGDAQRDSLEIRARGRVSSFRSATSPSDDDLPAPTKSKESLASPSDPFPYFSGFTSAQSPAPHTDDSWITDLELMHHYTSSTYQTLPRAEELQDVWQVRIPKLALSYPFLLHQVLATSAFHIAFLNRDDSRRYFMKASQHQSEAILGLRAALSEISPDSCHALFATSFLLSLCAFATYSDPKRTGGYPTLDDFQDVSMLIRGMSTILDSYHTILNSGLLSQMFQTDNPSPSSLLEAILGQLHQLNISADSNLTNADAEVCRQAVSATITWIQQALSGAQEPELRMGMSWSICLSEDFLGLIRNRNPTALMIFAYQVVILHFCGEVYWYMRGWGRSMMQDIRRTLDFHYRDVMEWCNTTIQNIATFGAYRI